VLKPELLDSAEQGLADRNLRDLVRINRWCGGHRVLLRVLGDLVGPREQFSVLDVGAGSGDMGQCIRERFPNANVILSDYRSSHLRSATLPCVAADGFRLPFLPRTFDFVICSSFLHHFSDGEVIDLIREMRSLARRALIVLDLERHPIPYYFLPMTRRVFRWSTLTLHDGPISVAAGFRTEELAFLTGAEGMKGAVVRRHRPWFRLSVVVPAIPSSRAPGTIRHTVGNFRPIEAGAVSPCPSSHTIRAAKVPKRPGPGGVTVPRLSTGVAIAPPIQGVRESRYPRATGLHRATSGTPANRSPI
jgi:SAM-dependent methyltransferase